MRGGGLGGLRGASGFDHDDRLGEGYLAGGGQKRPRVADGFHVDDDAARVRIITQMVNQVTPADIEHRTRGKRRR